MNKLSLQIKTTLRSNIYLTERKEICTFSTDTVLYNNASQHSADSQSHGNV
jgi:hypothetical protein